MKQSLFRTIRRKLLDEGKLVRYLTYALGEVFLIFFGITLAIGFENSREQRRQEKLANGLLAAIQINLQANVTELEQNIKEDDLTLESTSIVLTHISNNKTWGEDSLSAHLEKATR